MMVQYIYYHMKVSVDTMVTTVVTCVPCDSSHDVMLWNPVHNNYILQTSGLLRLWLSYPSHTHTHVHNCQWSALAVSSRLCFRD